MGKYKLSIIIPAYNADPYLPDLLACLDKQMVPGVEVIIIDDGSKIPFKTDYSWATVIRQKNAGPGIARNAGLDKMTGEYFTFIDADDMVADNYLAAILDKIKTEQFDYCYLSWKTLPGGWQCSVQLRSVEDKFPGFNLCVWNRVYKTATFGKHKFNPKKLWSEDADFIYRLKEHGKKSFISEYLYFYRSDTPNSWTKRMMSGDLDYCRIVYNLKEVKADNTELLEEIKREYADNEIVLLTDRNEIPELERYCMVMRYNTPVHGDILRGDTYSGFKRIEKPKRTQVIIWTAVTQQIGGIETWIFNFVKNMSKYYDIVVLYDRIDGKQLARLEQYVECIKQNPKQTIICDTIIVNRITDKVPDNIKARQSIQMVHACKMVSQWSIPQNTDCIVGVSQAALDSFNEPNGQVIHNLTDKPTDKRCLLLISATRLSKTSAFEKGHARMLKLADMLHEAQIPFLWLIFSDQPLKGVRENMVVLPPTLDIAPYLARADYYVSLSDAEGYGYSMVESLINGTALITTPIDVLPEISFKDGFNGYVVPFDLDEFDVQKLLDIPQFEYKTTNTKSIKQWRKLLGDTKPTHAYNPHEKVKLRVTQKYHDTNLNRIVNVGEVLHIHEKRAEIIQSAGYGRIINGEV
jgi:glycosyltransferase involved in cell wall biosynthesis